MDIGFKLKKVEETPSSTTNTQNVQNNTNTVQKRLKNFEVTDSDREDYHNLVDILFVIDTTGSMQWCFEEAKNTVLAISEMFNKQEFDIKFALCQYRDHPPQDNTFVYQHNDLQGSGNMTQVLGTLQAAGGGDGPEAVMDGLYYGLVLTKWRKDEDGTASKRFIFHICDAPPHGQKYGGHSSDPNWRINGCPCNITAEKIKEQLDEKNVTYNLIECGGIGTMEQVFKQVFGNRFEETIHIDRNQAQQSSYSADIFSMESASLPATFGSSTISPVTNSLFGMPSSTSVSGGLIQPPLAGFGMSAPSSVPLFKPQQQQQQNLYSAQVQQNLLRNLM